MKTIVNFILDRSGSMESVREATISGFNEYIQSLQKDEKNKYEFTLTLFDTIVTRNETIDIKKVKPLNKETYVPDGFTALYDAVCSTIKNTQDKESECKDCGGIVHKQKILTVIMTDGGENASKEYDEKDMREMIQAREKQGNWTFVYLGANQDSYAAAAKYGISHGNTANFYATSAGAGAVFRGMSAATASFASSSNLNSSVTLASVKQDIENTK